MDSEDEYWVVVVNRESGFTETFGPYSRDTADRVKDVANPRTTYVAIVGKR